MEALQHHSHTATLESSQHGSWERSQLAWSEHYTIYNAATRAMLGQKWGNKEFDTGLIGGQSRGQSWANLGLIESQLNQIKLWSIQLWLMAFKSIQSVSIL